MALLKLSADEQRLVFVQLCNVLEPRIAVYLSSVSNELREPTQALLQQLKANHEAATAFCHAIGLWGCKKLREAKEVDWRPTWESLAVPPDLGLLGTLGSVLPALERLYLRPASSVAVAPDVVLRLAKGLGAGALPAVTTLHFWHLHLGDAGSSALAAALGRGALPRLQLLSLARAGIGDAGLVALAPALRRLPALEALHLLCNPLGDEGLTALVAPPLPAGALPPPTGVLAGLKTLNLCRTQITDAGCATLVSALDGGALSALEGLFLAGIPSRDAAVYVRDPPNGRAHAETGGGRMGGRLSARFRVGYG